MNAIDLFAGAGGWDVAAREYGIDPLGIELDEWACKTREAAGLRTLQGDVRLLDPADFECDLLLASPPCQHFSSSAPRRRVVSQTAYNISRRSKRRAYSDQGPELVEVALDWALKIRPSFVAFEQVPKVLGIWERHAARLAGAGYWTWTGVRDAYHYGVPQTRKRAILLASLRGPVYQPLPLELPAESPYPTIVCNRRSKGGIIVGRSLREGGVALSFAEAGEIQTFPVDYPWQGGVEAKSRQIGNAIPPRFAYAILSELFFRRACSMTDHTTKSALRLAAGDSVQPYRGNGHKRMNIDIDADGVEWMLSYLPPNDEFTKLLRAKLAEFDNL